MAIDYMKQATSYQGVSNGAIAIKGESGYGTPKKLPYLKSIPLTPSVGETPIFANNVRIETAIADTGFTGSIGTTAQEREIEKALGQIIDGANGDLNVNLISYVKAAIYYEFIQKTPEGIPYVVKNWLLNVEIGKASLNHQSMTDTSNIGEYTYPIIVLGELVQNAAGTEDYVDEHGVTRTCFRISAFPDTPGYATFSESVPVPKVANQEQGE